MNKKELEAIVAAILLRDWQIDPEKAMDTAISHAKRLTYKIEQS